MLNVERDVQDPRSSTPTACDGWESEKRLSIRKISFIYKTQSIYKRNLIALELNDRVRRLKADLGNLLYLCN